MDNAILCTVDFSEPSKDVLKYALNLSKRFNSHITILYTYRLLNANGEAIDARKKIEEQAKENFASLEREVLSGSGASYDFKIEVGFVSNRVKEYAKKNGVSFLVMGKKMNGSNKESFDELAENIQVPLVIVP
jgi:nucleotide-binding universal stress UspA family protein